MESKTAKPFAAIGEVSPTQRGETNEGLKHVQDYLVRFGYLRAGSYNPGELDNETSVALQRFQRSS